MTERQIKEAFILEIIEIYYSMQEECESIAEFFGCEAAGSKGGYGGIGNFDKQISRLQKVVLGLSGAVDRANAYHDKLVEIGAAACYTEFIDAVNCAMLEKAMTPAELAVWLLDYAEGITFGEITLDVLNTPPPPETPQIVPWLTNAQEVERCGLFKPRPPGKNSPHLLDPMQD